MKFVLPSQCPTKKRSRFLLNNTHPNLTAIYIILMKKIIFIWMFILVGCSINSQTDDSWTAFRDEHSERIGFQDPKGRIRIEARYRDFIIAAKFDRNMAVMEDNQGKSETYYLTRSGKKIGENSVYIFDNGPDCESEGFIRFKDRQRDKVGMFNGEGDIAIPAEYDDLSNVRNGLVIALKDARKKYPEGNKTSGCDHFSWEGGKEYLIDTHHKIIIDRFKDNSSLNLFSIQTGEEPVRDIRRKSYVGTDGRYYSFIDFKKEFQAWLNASVLKSLSRERLIESSYDKIYFWKESQGWTSAISREFIHRNYGLIKGRLSALNKKNSDYFISVEGLNPLIYEAPEFASYFDNCRQPKEWQYPVLNVVINHKTQNDFYQDNFEFLRTENGYKLISMTMRNAILK